MRRIIVGTPIGRQGKAAYLLCSAAGRRPQAAGVSGTVWIKCFVIWNSFSDSAFPMVPELFTGCLKLILYVESDVSLFIRLSACLSAIAAVCAHNNNTINRWYGHIISGLAFRFSSVHMMFAGECLVHSEFNSWHCVNQCDKQNSNLGFL